MTGDLELQIDQWRDYLQRHQAISADDVTEMEDHLRGQIDDLTGTGLDSDEAFLVAVKRMGSTDEISREFAREHSERLWKQLMLPTSDTSTGSNRSLLAALTCATGAAVALLLDIHLLPEGRAAMNGPLVVLTFVAGYFAWQRAASVRTVAAIAGALAVLALVLNLYPWRGNFGSTQVLAVTHSPVAAWFAVGIAYVGGAWRSSRQRMDFIRFTGEWIVYLALLALGGGALLGLTGGIFASLGMDPSVFIPEWLLPAGVAGAAVIAAWLVEAKQSVVENIAPVLTRVFTPLTIPMLVAVLVGFAVTFNVLDVGRDLLTLMDLILVLVLGLVLYATSARDPQSPPALFDRLQLALLGVALVVDAVLLVTMLSRIADAGFTANKVAALGLNLVLLVNLVRSTWLLFGFVRGRTSFAALERWQTAYLPAYGAWAAFVVLALPPLFSFA